MKKTLLILGVSMIPLLGITLAFSTGRVRAQNLLTVQNGRPKGDLENRFVAGRVLVKFRSNIGLDHARQIVAALGARDADEIPEIGVHIVDLPYSASEIAFVDAFSARPEVEFAELDRLSAPAQVEPNDPVFAVSANSWSLRKIKAPEAWQTSTGSSNVVIAVLDTGVDSTHEDLSEKIVPGWNVYNNNSDTRDVNGHGTGVAGVAAASTNNGIGVAAVAWGCKIMPVRISDPSGYASYSAMANGLKWAADHGATVANISYNAAGSSTVSTAAKYFRSKGGIVVAAAGNGGTSVKTPDDPYMITVGATDPSDVLYYWSNSGENLDLTAPGNASEPMNGGGYAGGGGTSVSCPFVAGAAALIMSVNPNLTPTRVETILEQTADDLGAIGWDSIYGHGRLNLEQAINLAFGSVGFVDSTPPLISIISPAQGTVVSGTVVVAADATDNVGVVKVQLYVDGKLYGSSITAPFNVKWNTRKASKGAHVLQSKAFDFAGNVGTSCEITVYQ